MPNRNIEILANAGGITQKTSKGRSPKQSGVSGGTRTLDESQGRLENTQFTRQPRPERSSLFEFEGLCPATGLWTMPPPRFATSVPT